MNSEELATRHSYTCFLNAFLREWSEYKLANTTAGVMIYITLKNASVITIPLRNYSPLGRHQYTSIFLLDDKEIYFKELVQLLCDYLTDYYQVKTSQVDIFKQRVFASLTNMQKSIDFRKDSLNPTHFTFKQTEQALLIGHNFHPTPKSRDEFSDEDMMHYSPEFASSFALHWYAVDPCILHHQTAAAFADKQWLQDLYMQDCEQSADLSLQGMIPVPMHPWQFAVLAKRTDISAYIEEGKLIYLGVSKKHWHATSSLRTVYRDDAIYMLKFSMSLKMTNSIRVLLSREVNRGLLLHDVLTTEKGKQFIAENPGFSIITEPAYFCFKDSNDNPIEESIVVCRENPFVGHISTGKIMLASLTQDCPFGGDNFLQKILYSMDSKDSIHVRAKKWFSAYLDVVVKPLIVAYGNYGIVMEAHQQNIVLDLMNGTPVGSYFRDCQDHAYSELGFRLFSDKVPGINHNNASVAEPNNAKCFFIYQVFLNATFNIITSLANREISEQELLDDLRLFLQKLHKSGLSDARCMDSLLNDTKLLQKGNFMHAFRGVNDNTIASNPLDLYVPIVNPIVEPLNYPLYQQYFHAIKKKITLRLLDINRDLEIFHAWQHKPYVAKFWELDASLGELQSYLNELQNTDYQQAVIIEMNDVAVGYCEIYWAAKDRIAKYYDYQFYDRGFHLLIGEQSYLGIQNTSSVFLSIMDYLYLHDERTKRLVVEPNKDNQRFIKYTTFIPGWKYMKEIDLPEKKAALILSHKNEFKMECVI